MGRSDARTVWLHGAQVTQKGKELAGGVGKWWRTRGEEKGRREAEVGRREAGAGLQQVREDLVTCLSEAAHAKDKHEIERREAGEALVGVQGQVRVLSCAGSLSRCKGWMLCSRVVKRVICRNGGYLGVVILWSSCMHCRLNLLYSFSPTRLLRAPINCLFSLLPSNLKVKELEKRVAELTSDNIVLREQVRGREGKRERTERHVAIAVARRSNRRAGAAGTAVRVAFRSRV